MQTIEQGSLFTTQYDKTEPDQEQDSPLLHIGSDYKHGFLCILRPGAWSHFIYMSLCRKTESSGGMGIFLPIAQDSV
jgi:hypothetical protein